MQITLELLVSQTLEGTRCILAEVDPARSPDAFLNELLDAMARTPDLDGEELLREFESSVRTEHVSAQHFPMLLTLAHCALVKRELEKKPTDREAAWSHMATARYWSGVTYARKGIEKARAMTISATRSNTAAKGGDGRTENYYKATIKQTYLLATQLRPKLGWPSRRNAAIEIAPKVCEFAASIRKPLSSNNASTTIDGWLKDMPDFRSLMRSK